MENNKYKCVICGEVRPLLDMFKNTSMCKGKCRKKFLNMKNYKKKKQEMTEYTCPKCNKAMPVNLKCKDRNCCKVCNRLRDKLRKSKEKKKKRRQTNFRYVYDVIDPNFKLIKTSINGQFKEYEASKELVKKIVYERDYSSVISFLKNFTGYHEFLVNFKGSALLSKDGHQIINVAKVQSEPTRIFLNQKEIDLYDIITKAIEELLETTPWSGLIVVEIETFIIQMTGFVFAHVGGCYKDLPKPIKSRCRGILNIRNKNNKCFAYCYGAFKNPLVVEERQKLNDMVILDETDPFYYNRFVEDLVIEQFPVAIEDIPRVEQLNPDLNVRVYGLIYNDSCYAISTLYETKNRNTPVMNLMLYEGHYSLIRKIDSVRRLSFEGHNFICRHCGLCGLKKIEGLRNHEMSCQRRNKSQSFYPPKPMSKIQFADHYSKIELPFLIVGDCESYFSHENLPEDKNSIRIENKHVMFAIGYKVIANNELSEHFKQTRMFIHSKETNFAENFLNSLVYDVKLISSWIRNKCEMFEDTCEGETKCFVCNKNIDGDYSKIYNPFTREYIGDCHVYCKKKAVDIDKIIQIPFYFHNFGGYDSHLLIGIIGKKFKIESTIAKTSEKIISMIVSVDDIKIRFLDSLCLMNSSLSKLASKLTTWKFIPDTLSDLRTKQHFPYSYFSYKHGSIDEILEQPNLPQDPIIWDNELKRKYNPDEFTPEENEKGLEELALVVKEANEAFVKHGCKNMRDEVRLYLEVDILLLAEVIEDFRKTNLKTWGIDPCYFVSLPGYSWRVMLNFTNIKLDLLDDIDFILFFQNDSIRGGVSTVCQTKHLKANNPLMGDLYNPFEDENYILYFDITNLYGKAMTFKLPYGGFQWVSESDFDAVYEKNIVNFFKLFDMSGDEGFIFEVDMEYPEELHDKHIGLPLAPVHRNGKLVPSFEKRHNYKIHYIALRVYVKLGMKVTQIHKIIRFRQKAWLADYINKNTQIRRDTNIPSEKDNAKLMNNAVYGKTMENKIGRQNSVLKTSNQMSEIYKVITDFSFKSFNIINEDIIQLNRHKDEIVFDSPIYVGFSILDLSKAWFYHQIYNVVIPNFKTLTKNVELSYVDTDSVILQVPKNPIEVFRTSSLVQDHFDLSVYADNLLVNEFFTAEVKNKNKGVLGTFKDEYAKTVIIDFVCLRSKSYSVFTMDDYRKSHGNINYNGNTKKTKGASNIDRQTHANFYGVLINETPFDVFHRGFQSFDHTICTTNKLIRNVISSDDNKREPDKRYNDKIHTVPFGFVYPEDRQPVIAARPVVSKRTPEEQERARKNIMEYNFHMNNI